MKKYFLILFLIILSGCINIGDSSLLISGSDSSGRDAIINNMSEGEYSQYIDKIWVADGWEGDAYIYPCSFFIEKIEDGIISGKLSTGGIAYPDFFYNRDESRSDLVDLIGTVNHDVAEVLFHGENGDAGKIKLVFKQNGKIEATIEYVSINFMNKETYYDNLYKIYGETEEGREFFSKLMPMDGSYIFRPYNISDIIEGIDLTRVRIVDTDLNSWGDVNLVTVVFNGKKPHPAAYLTDQENNIIYVFRAPFQVGTEIIDVVIEDLNGDNLKDVKLINNFVDNLTDEIEPRIFYQMDNGMFYDSNLDVK